MDAKTSIDFILSHFDENNLFPRKMMTKGSNGQFIVHSKEGILFHCKESNYVDCRINAYPLYQTSDYISDIQPLSSPPDFVFIDLDLNSFEKYVNPKKMLDNTLRNTLERILKVFRQHSPSSQSSQAPENFMLCENDKINLQVKPTVLWTGNGYHVYLPIQSLPLDAYEPFSRENYPNLFSMNGGYTRYSVSELFLEYAEYFITNGKADTNHRPTFKSCLIRIPDTFNSKRLHRGCALLRNS